MPANLTPQYHKAEQAYRQASTPEEELACLQEMLKEIPKHKGTDKLQADLKQKIARLRDEVAAGKKSGGKSAHRIPRQGAGRAILLGAPNTGKSQLLAALTRATPEIAPYPYTTREPHIGMMPWEDVFVQLIDTPPISRDVFDPTVTGLIRGADLVVLLVDLGSDDGAGELNELLAHFADGKTRFGRETMLDEEDVGVTYTQTVLAANKTDLPEAADRLEFFREFLPTGFDLFPISALTGAGLPALRDRVYRACDVIRVYTKLPTKKEPDMEKPFTVKQGGTLMELAELIHRDVAKNLKSARVWGTAIHPGTTVKSDYVLHDRDIVEIHSA
ncbi:MAG: GTPase [Planctomycetota bacterium]